jgi:RecA/RadA recombinase
LLEGDPGQGKSTLALDIAANVTRGDGALGGPAGAPANVILITFEDGVADTVRPRFDVLGGDASRLYVFRGVEQGVTDERQPRFPDDFGYLSDIIELHEAALVIVDPLGAAFNDNTDSHKDAAVRRVTAGLARIAEATGATILGIRHLIKGGATNAVRAGGGSIGLIAAARVGLRVSEHPDDMDKPPGERRRILAIVKNNLAPHSRGLVFALIGVQGRSHARIQWLGETPITADDLNAAHAANMLEDRNAKAERATWLLGVLKDGPIKSRDVFEAGYREGYNERSLGRTADALGVIKHRAGTGVNHHTTWSLPESKGTPDSQPRRGQVSGVSGVSGVPDVAESTGLAK